MLWSMDNSSPTFGARLSSSCLPKGIINLTNCSVENFKAKQVAFLAKIPDEPKTETLTPAGCNQFSGKPSNSLI